MTLSEAKEIAKTIHEYVEEKRQEPTGNQNCLLCVWCSEARFRGFRVLPRPVYSPRDSIFKHHEHGLDIVHDAVKESISSIDDIKKKCVNDARYYCHVNWKDSKGGHEFLLIVIDDGIYVMDSQANIVAPITSEDGEYYFNDINWDNSFIARIDDKKLNKSLLFRENSMIKVLPWDEEADVKFLIDNGMVSSELTLPEGISIRKAIREDIEYVYECELETSDQEEIQKQEKRDEVMKDAKDSIEHTQIIMRGSNKIGIYQAYKTNQYGMKQEPYDWWYIAEIYIEPAYRSMGIGSALIKRDIEIHGKIMLHVLLSNKRAIKLYESLGFEKDQENGYGGLIMRIDKSKVIKEAYEHDYSGDMKLPDGIGFRRATENDVSDIYTWRLEAIAKRLRDNEQAKQYVMDDTKRHLNDAYIITYNGKDVGVYVGYKIDDGWWYISTIHILKEYRGQGIGSAIMRRDCACRNKICLRVDPHNTRARKFYKSLGFRVTDKSNKASYVMRYEKGKRPRRVQESFMDEYDPFKDNNISDDVKDIIINTGIYGTYLNIFDDEELLWMSTEDLPDSITFNPNVTYMSKSYENVQVELLTLLDIAKNIQSEMDSSKNSVFSFKIGTIDIPSVGKKSILVDSETGNIYVDKKGSKFKISDNIKTLLNKSIQEGFVNEKTGLIPVKDYPYDTVYMGTPTEKIPKKDVYFVTPYMSTASIFIGRDKVVPLLRDKGLHNYNLDYEEWGSKDKKPLNTVHIKVKHSRYHPEDNIPYFEPFEFEATGYLHTIDLSKMKDHIYVYDWMSKEFEAIVSDVDELDVIKTEKVTIKYYVTWDDSEHKNSDDVYRIEYGDKKIGIYEALKQAMIKDGKSDEWKKFLNNPDVKKLPEPPEYKEGYESWFTEKGKVEVWDKIKDIFFEYLDRSKFHFTKRSIERIKKYEIVYSDEYQYVIDKNKSVQESFVQEQYFYEHGKKLYFHCSRDGNLDGQIFKPRVPEYIERYDPEDTGFENSTTPRICLAPTIEGCLNGIAVNMPRISPLAFDRVYVYTPEKPFNEYKHKTNKELVRDKDVYDANITDEVWILEPVRMKLYGIIQVDQCSNVKKKKAVETPSGKYEKRNVFKYKWHWLVKPKVLDKATKFNYDPKQVCELLLMDLPKFKYGLIKDGRLSISNNSEADYDKYWKMHTPEEVDEAGGGNCYDITEYEAGFLDAYGVPFNKYFISALTPDGKKHSTHTFIVVKISDKYKYIEGAFKRVIDEIGYSKDFDKLNDIFDYIVECMVEYDNVDEYQFGVFDYTDHTPTKGVSIKKFEDYVTTNGENIYEGTKSKNKECDSK